MIRFRTLAGVAGITVCVAMAASTLAGASETINYSYDAKGRVVKVVRSGSVNNNVVANYTFDKADNRKSLTVTGAP